jgi:PAS domain S-box-containing protein
MRLRIGIAGRTALLLTLVAAAAIAGAGWWLARRQARAERELVEARAGVLADAVERSLAEAMGEHRPASMRVILDAVSRTDGVLGVAIAGRNGAVRYGAGSVPDGLGSPPEGTRVEWSEGRLALLRPVENGPSCRGCHGAEMRRSGTILVRYDGSLAVERAVAAARRMALLAGLALLLTAAGTAAVLRRTVARPLAALQRFAEALGRGDLAARPPRAGGEIGGLAEALRRMADEVQRSHEVLEGRVAERTAKLAEALGAAEAAREERSAALTRLQAIVDSMADGVIFVDAGARVALVNEAAQALRNLRGGVGRPLKDCHPQASHATLDRVMAWLERGDDAGPAHSIIKEKEGRYETTYAPVRAPGGGFLGVVMVIRDIAERRGLERRLLDAERLAGLGQMSAQVAHELRSPLNAINGAADYLRRVLPGSPEVQEYAALIGDEVQRVSRFVDELLHVSRPANPLFAPASVNRLLDEAARRVLLARGLPEGAIRLDLEKGLPPMDLDREMILEAVVNLLDNALEAGPEAAPEIASRFEASGGEGSVAVEVRDRGAGIPAEMIDEVTRPFVTTKAQGTGLGLVIVSRAAEQHRARFSLHPRPGGGTVARLWFPVRRVQAPGAAAEAEEAAP